MKHGKPITSGVAAVCMLMILSACDSSLDDDRDRPTPPAETSEVNVASPPVDVAGAAGSTPVSVDTPALAPPAFAPPYPGGVADGSPMSADGDAGEGALTTFTTDDPPETVVSFYRQRAEADGLTSVMAMDQGEARAYGAEARTGASLQVVAAPDGEGATSVQLSWSRGQ